MSHVIQNSVQIFIDIERMVSDCLHSKVFVSFRGDTILNSIFVPILEDQDNGDSVMIVPNIDPLGRRTGMTTVRNFPRKKDNSISALQ